MLRWLKIDLLDKTRTCRCASQNRVRSTVYTKNYKLPRLSAHRRESGAARFAAARAAAFALLCLVALQCPAQAGNPVPKQVPTTSASTEQILSTYEGQKVTAVEIAGRPESRTDEYQAAFQQKAGQPFSRAQVDSTADALKAAAHCQVVRIEVDPEADGVRVVFILEPAVYFGIFQFPGAERFAYSRLIQVSNYPIQEAYNADDVEKDKESLAKFLQQQGYFQSEVKTELNVDSARSVANVVFHVTLGRPARFGTIDIVDSTPSQTEALTHSLKTFLALAKGAAIRPGKAYHFSNLGKATEYLQSALEKQGRLGAKVRLAGADYHADTNRADIHFNVDPGPETAVTIEGAHVWSSTRKSLLPVYEGIGVDDESVEEGRQALISYFQAKGFFDVAVDAQLKDQPERKMVVYQIKKGSKHKVASVSVSGNHQLNSSELDPHLTVEKSHLFSPGDFSDRLVRTSVQNLTAVYKSEGFSSVHVTSKVLNRGGNIQVQFEVAEGPRDVVKSITIEGADTFPESKFAPKDLKLAAGQPYSQAHVQSDRTTIIANYLQAGYLTASFRETAAEVSKQDPHEVNVVYHIDEGPKVDAGDVITLGRTHTKQRLIDKDVSSIKTGEPLTESSLLVAGSKLYDHPGVFDWAEVDPKRDITTQTDEDVLVKVHEAKRNELTYGFGFEVINRGGSIPSGTVALPNLPPVGLPSGFKTSQATF
jgi:outer membrane protein insertion porin family